LALATTGVMVVLALGACSGKSDETVIDRPTDDGPSDGTPAAQGIVASIESAGGLAGDQAPTNLIFELDADGTVFTSGGGAFGIAYYKLSNAGLDRANELLGQIEVDEGAYGEPSITDMPSTTFTLRPDGGTGPAEEMSVYALTDLPDDVGDLGLSGGQQDAREALQGVLDGLTALPDEADLVDVEPADYVPTDLDVSFIPVFTDQGATPAEPLLWPLTTPLTDMQLGWEGVRPCTGFHGDDATALVDAMGIEAPGPQEQPWSTGAAGDVVVAPRQVMAQVQAVLPQHPSCTAQPEPEVPPETPPLLDGGPFYPIQLVDMFDWHGTFVADERRNAEPLEVFAALPAIATGAASQLGLSDSDLGQYDYLATVSTKNGKTFLELGAIEPGEQVLMEEADWGWQARVDLANGELVSIEEI
jgi:hypothetical protein